MDEEVRSITDEEIFKDTKHDYARKMAAYDLLENDLKFKTNEIEISEVKMCHNFFEGILWITVNENNVRRIFSRASIIKNRNIRLFNFIPQQLYRRKKILEDNLKKAKLSNPRLHYQIRLGNNDLALLTKEMKPEIVFFARVTIRV